MKKSHWRLVMVATFVGLGVVMPGMEPTALAMSSNHNHELGVYSLKEYGTYEGESWKANLPMPYSDPENYLNDPAGAFWDLMTTGATSEYAHTDSRKRENDRVNIHTIFPIAGDGWKDWNQFDLVFFFGHNNMITPPHPCYDSHFWSNSSGHWAEVTGGMCDWGTARLPYEYYPTDITAGEVSPGAVIYLHEPFTSALPGWHFIPGRGSVAQTQAQDTPAGNTAGTTISCPGGLGTGGDLEWLILHGCQAVIVANEEGTAYHPMGATAFSLSWDGFHIVMGHYRSYGMGELRDLSPMATNLLAGEPVQAAYFLTYPRDNLSAIAAEHCGTIDPERDHAALADYLRDDSYMNTDTWLAPKSDITGNPNLWYVKWIREDGTAAEDWREPFCGRIAGAREGTGATGWPQRTEVDLTDYHIKDPDVQKALGMKAIPIRSKSYVIPDQDLPVLKLREVPEEEARAKLTEIRERYGTEKAGKKPENDLGYSVAAKDGTQVFWVAKASGASSYSETKASMARPTSIRNPRQAVELALKQVVLNKLVELGPQESLDVVFVSHVVNAAVKDPKAKKTLVQYPADYFVGLGRRYKGVPVVGSKLVLRLGEDGKVLGMQKNWRPIVGELGQVSIKKTEWQERLRAKLEAQKVLKPGQTLDKDIRILNVGCGYLEGPILFEQKQMAPGCIVSYRPVKHSDPADQFSQVVVPLAKTEFDLLGSLKKYPPAPADPDKVKPVTDPDDKGKDEEQ